MEKEEKNRFVLATVGAFIGAFIGAIPWILMYIFADMMYALLAIVIIIGSYYGYRITKAKIDKKLPVILSIASFVSITLTMYVVIPLCLMAQNGIPLSMENLISLYQYDEFSAAILSDYFISLLFCALVMSGIVVSIHRQIKEGVDSKDIRIFQKEVNNEEFSKEDIETVRNIFDKNNALDKKNTASKEILLEDLTSQFDETKGKRIWDYLKAQGVIKKKADGYYFSEKSEKSPFARYGISSVRTFIIVLLIAIALACVIVFNEERQENSIGNENEIDSQTLEEYLLAESLDTKTFDTGVDDLSLAIPEDMVILSDAQISYLYGEEYLQIYDCIAMSTDFEKMIMVFTDEKANYDIEYTAEEYIKAALNDEEITVEENTYNGHTFYSAITEYTDSTNEREYTSNNLVFDAGDKFICIVFDTPAGDTINVEEVIQ